MFNRNGVITIFISIMLTFFVAFTGIMIDLVRASSAKVFLEQQLMLTTDSVLTKYDTALKERYGLMALHIEDDTELYLYAQYVEKLLYENLSFYNDDTIHPYDYDIKSINIKPVMSFADNNYVSIKNQIVEFMKYRAPIRISEDFLDKFISYKNLSKQTELMNLDIELEKQYTKNKANTVLLERQLQVIAEDISNRNYKEFEIAIKAILIEKLSNQIIDMIRSDIVNYEREVKTQKKQLISTDSIEDKIDKINNKLKDIKKNKQKYEEDLKELESQLQRIKDHNSRINQRIESIQSNIYECYGLEDELEEKLSNSEINQKIFFNLDGYEDYYKKVSEAKEYIQDSLGSTEKIYAVVDEIENKSKDIDTEFSTTINERAKKIGNTYSEKNINQLNEINSMLENIEDTIKRLQQIANSFSSYTPTIDNNYKEVIENFNDIVNIEYDKLYKTISNPNVEKLIESLLKEGNIISNFLEEFEIEIEKEEKEYILNKGKSAKDDSLSDVNMGTQYNKIKNLIKQSNEEQSKDKKIYIKIDQDKLPSNDNTQDSIINFEADFNNINCDEKTSSQQIFDNVRDIEKVDRNFLESLYLNEYIISVFKSSICDASSLDSMYTKDIRGNLIKDNKTVFNKGEIEYIIIGSGNEWINISGVKSRIIAIRFASNLASAYIDTNKRNLTLSAASTLALGTPFTYLVQLAIMSAWSLGESLIEIPFYNQGEGFPLFKTNWILDLNNIPSDLSQVISLEIDKATSKLIDDTFIKINQNIESEIEMMLNERFSSIENFISDKNNIIEEMFESMINDIDNSDDWEIIKECKKAVINEIKMKVDYYYEDSENFIDDIKSSINYTINSVIIGNDEATGLTDYIKTIVYSYKEKIIKKIKQSIDIGLNNMEDILKDSKNSNTAKQSIYDNLETDYYDYLRILLLLENNDEKIERILDLIQLNLDKDINNYYRGVTIEVEASIDTIFLNNDLIKNIFGSKFTKMINLDTSWTSYY